MTELAKRDPIVKVLTFVFKHVPNGKIAMFAARMMAKRSYKIDPVGTAESEAEMRAELDVLKAQLMRSLNERGANHAADQNN